jgi:Bacteriophage Lambda NinG protein
MARQRDYWTCYTCGTSVKPSQKDGRGVSMALYMYAGHYKPQGTFRSIKYDPMNVHAQDVRWAKWLRGNLSAYATALEMRYGFGILQKLEQRSNLFFEHTIPKLEALTAAAQKGIEEYFNVYEAMRPKTENELSRAA